MNFLNAISSWLAKIQVGGDWKITPSEVELLIALETHFHNERKCLCAQWKETSKALPRIGRRVLSIDMNDENPYVDIDIYFGDDDWSSYSCNTKIPTHWMYLPEKPDGMD